MRRERAPILRILVGLLLVVLGIVLALHAQATIQAFALLLAAGLGLAGVQRIIAAREAGRPWVERAAGGLQAALGAAAVLWGAATLSDLAVLASVALLAGGEASLIKASRGERGEHLADTLDGLASIAFGALLLAWP